MTKVMFFVDGFNLYHAMKDMIEGHSYGGHYTRPNPAYNKYKWLDLEKLCEQFIDAKNGEELAGIKYFTAYALWKPGLVRHKLYVSALQAKCKNIEVVFGKFKPGTKHCNLCNKTFNTHSEKLTDVNIAIYLFENAYLDTFDKAVIVSGDSDLIPSILAIKRNFPNKKIGVIIPIGRQGIDLSNNAHFSHRIRESHLHAAQLPDQISNSTITRPVEWL